MHFPKPDNIFGSAYIIVDIRDVLLKEALNDTGLYQYLELERTLWKSLDTPEKKCDMENVVNTTKCITSFLEQTIGCSMGLAEGNPDMDR